MKQKIKGTPPRLSVVYQRFEAPLYLVTFNTLFRRPLLAHDSVHTAFQHYAEQGLAFHVGTGRYVLMPDHVHVFVRIGPDMTLRRWIGGLKQCLGKALRALGHDRWRNAFGVGLSLRLKGIEPQARRYSRIGT